MSPNETIEQEVPLDQLPKNATPTERQLVAVSNPILETARALVIDSPVMYEVAAEELQTVKRRAKELTERRLEITRPLDAAKKSVMDLFRKPIDALEQAEGVIKRTMLAYDNEQRRIAEEARREAEAAAAAERKRIEEQAREAEAKGDAATAAALQFTAAVVTAAPAVVEDAPKAAGIAKVTRWSAEVTDKVAFLRHVLDSAPELIDTVQVEMKALNQMAVALKDKLNIPGIKAVANESLSARV